ncbi:hypothetical protein D8911_05840 [Levilactobacillus brevis]|nr:hypothetical protein D8911_05840 [Levilactobacillus brevis]
MGSAVGVLKATWFMPLLKLASLRREFRLKDEASRPPSGSTRPPTAFRPIFGEREAASSDHAAANNPSYRTELDDNNTSQFTMPKKT